MWPRGTVVFLCSWIPFARISLMIFAPFIFIKSTDCSFVIPLSAFDVRVILVLAHEFRNVLFLCELGSSRFF